MTLLARNLGARLEPQQNVAEIFDTRYDNARLLELERTQSSLQTDLKAQLVALARARNRLQEQAARYQDGRVQQIEARIGEATAALESAQARLREAESALKRTADLSARGLQTTITLDRAKAGNDVAAQDVPRTHALMEIGGFPTESVTEDFLVTLRLDERGWRTVYLNEPLTEGLAPEGLQEYIVQRCARSPFCFCSRWAAC